MNYEEMMSAFMEEVPVLYQGCVYPKISAIITKKIVPGLPSVYHIAELEMCKNCKPVLCKDYGLLKIYDKEKHDELVWKNYSGI